MLIDAYDQTAQQDGTVHEMTLDDVSEEQEPLLRADDCRVSQSAKENPY